MDDKTNLRVVVVEPRRKPYVKDIDGSLESLQSIVGGYIEMICPFDEPVAIICNEEGKINELPLNRVLRDNENHIIDVVAGTFFVCACGLDDFTSLSDEQIEKYIGLFRQPEDFVAHDGKLIVIPLQEDK